MNDIGHGVKVVKAKAHTDEMAIDDGIITRRDRLGNMLADAEARKGAALAEQLSPTGRARMELVKALRWTSWARRLAASWVDDVGADDGRGGGHRRRQEGDGGGKRKGTGGGAATYSMAKRRSFHLQALRA